MSQKRGREHGESRGQDESRKKQKKGFTVGPANLPDGTYKRKNKKIKEALIQKAQIRKNYAKVKSRLPQSEHERNLYSASPSPAAETEEPSTEPHPDRQTLITKEAESPEPAPVHEELRAPQRRERKRKPKPVPFKREYDEAQQRKAEAEERRKAREEAERERQRKMEERERFRRAMAKARTGGKNGQRKLGRESNVLLERVKRMIGEGG